VKHGGLKKKRLWNRKLMSHKIGLFPGWLTGCKKYWLFMGKFSKFTYKQVSRGQSCLIKGM
jgi:hypothetical protein